MKYSDQFADWLVERNYTHCFFVAGGNIMHLLDSLRSRVVCVPVIHEVAAGIAVEYFNEVSGSGGPRAFALVTAGPGLTNVLTAMAGAYLESRELLVIGGQVKSSDLARGAVRQRGIQEVDGLALAGPVSVATLRIERPLPREDVLSVIDLGGAGRPGPVFVEFCLDAQAAAPVNDDPPGQAVPERVVPARLPDLRTLLLASERPVLLLGGGVERGVARSLLPSLTDLGIPIATTWNGADRVPSDHPLYFGRPNTWGMRWSNILLQQADLVIAVGTRLGLQQTGFNWQGFAPLATVIQVDIDPAELGKGHPRVDVPVQADSEQFLRALLSSVDVDSAEASSARDLWSSWARFGGHVREALPLSDPGNSHGEGFVDPYDFVIDLSDHLTPGDVVVPCSSGGAFTVMMQAFANKAGQTIVTDKGLASMGYGLSGAIGAAVAATPRRVVLVEGDGGLAQNLQELGTLAARGLGVKVIVFANEGYASIRMTQRNYFGGEYVGCDVATGLGLPAWGAIFDAYGIPHVTVDGPLPQSARALELLAAPGPAALVVSIDPEQTYFPKIDSRVTATGGMESSPLQAMSPALPADVAADVLRHLPEEMRR